jgi:DNA-binding NarL/FixJ family response regulator
MQTLDSSLNEDAGAKPVTKRRILVVDDHPVFRVGVVKLLEAEPDLVVCGDVASALEALSALRQTPCDGVMVDISLPGANGIELIKQIKAEHPNMPILMMSMHDESLYALRSLRSGALGYVMKREGPEAMLNALRKVLSGQICVSSAFGEQLIFKMARGQETGSGSPIDNLSDRELEVLHLVGQGQSSHQIATSLHLSVKTIESHRLHIKEKLGFKNAAEMVRFAMDWHAEQSSLKELAV